MRQFFLSLLLLPSILVSSAQSNFKKNDIYLEVGGAGLFGSLNYERQLTKETGLGIRVGVGVYGESSFYLTLPVGLNYLFPLKNGRSFIDAGTTVSFTQEDGKMFSDDKNSNNENFVNFVPSIGYRIHTQKNMMMRFSFTPVINKYTFVPWIGISIGKRF